VSLKGAETPHGAPGSAKSNKKNPIALENAANENRNCSSKQFFSSLLDLEAANPKNPFTIVIWGENRAKFGVPEEKYRDKDICSTGTITSFRGSPEMVLTDPGQISTGNK